MADGSPRQPRAPRAPAPRALPDYRGRHIDVEIGRLIYPGTMTSTPATRAECPKVRPCPHVACRYNNYLDVTETGSLRAPGHEPWEQQASSSCSLDAASKGGMSLTEVARVYGMTPERVRQIEVVALAKLRARALELGMTEDELRSVLTPVSGHGVPGVMKGDY